MNIALGLSPVTLCPPIDPDGNGDVIDQRADRRGERAADRLPGRADRHPAEYSHRPRRHGYGHAHATPSGSPTPTPTATVNQPPVLPTASIYRTFPAFPIAVPIGASDPEGGPFACTVEQPACRRSVRRPDRRAELDAGAKISSARSIYRSCVPMMRRRRPQAPERSPSGCRRAIPAPSRPATRRPDAPSPLPPVTDGTHCCGGGPVARVPEPVAGCPEGRVLYVGQNGNVEQLRPPAELRRGARSPTSPRPEPKCSFTSRRAA